jgi:hypothetical protein
VDQWFVVSQNAQQKVLGFDLGRTVLAGLVAGEKMTRRAFSV